MISVAAWQHSNPNARRAEKERRFITLRYVDRRLGPVERVERLGKMKAKILCERHNALLSPLDAEGGRLGNALRDFFDRVRPSKKGARHDPVVHRVSGPLVERWLMKTLINLARTYSRGLPVGGADADVDYPTARLVKLVYGLRPVVPPVGMWYVKPQRPIVITDTSLNVGFYNRPDYIGGGYMNIAGFVFVVSLCPVEPDWEVLRDMLKWKTIEHCRPLKAMGHNAAAVQVHFSWPRRTLIDGVGSS